MTSSADTKRRTAWLVFALGMLALSAFTFATGKFHAFPRFLFGGKVILRKDDPFWFNTALVLMILLGVASLMRALVLFLRRSKSADEKKA